MRVHSISEGRAAGRQWSRSRTRGCGLRRAGLLDDPGQRVGAAEYERGDGHRIAAAMFTGAGLGLVTFTGIALIADAAARRRRGLGAAPLLAPGLAGLSLRGRFRGGRGAR